MLWFGNNPLACTGLPNPPERFHQSAAASFEWMSETAPDHDVDLLRRMANGDREAFAEFYDRHSALMFSVACKILNDSSEAEDVLQEVCLQIWEKARSFNSNLGKASSWAADPGSQQGN